MWTNYSEKYLRLSVVFFLICLIGTITACQDSSSPILTNYYGTVYEKGSPEVIYQKIILKEDGSYINQDHPNLPIRVKWKFAKDNIIIETEFGVILSQWEPTTHANTYKSKNYILVLEKKPK